jgi:hypothetical protein
MLSWYQYFLPCTLGAQLLSRLHCFSCDDYELLVNPLQQELNFNYIGMIVGNAPPDLGYMETFCYHYFATCLKDHHVYDPQMVGLYHNLHHIACPFFLTLQMSGGFMKNLVLFHMFLLFVALSHFDEVFVNPIEIQFLIFVWWQRHDFFFVIQ